MNTIHDIILIIRQVFYLLIKIAFHPQLKKVIFSKKKKKPKSFGKTNQINLADIWLIRYG